MIFSNLRFLWPNKNQIVLGNKTSQTQH